MTKAELETKQLSELHALAAEAGVEKYRMLSRAELVAKLSDGDGGGTGSGGGAPSRSGSPRRERSSSSRRGRREPREREEKKDDSKDEQVSTPSAPKPAPAAAGKPAPAEQDEGSRPRRRRRRRSPFGRRGKEGIAIQDLLLPPEAGRQAILCAETRAGCTALLRGVAADLASASKGPDPVVLLIDPGPEELADWKREAPQAEIVAAGQARHASDALAQATSRAGEGEDIILLVDSLTRLASDFGDTDTAKEFFDAGRTQGAGGGGSLTIVAAIERS